MTGSLFSSSALPVRRLAGLSLLRVGTLPLTFEHGRQRFAEVPTWLAFLSSLRRPGKLLWRDLTLMGLGIRHLSTNQLQQFPQGCR